MNQPKKPKENIPPYSMIYGKSMLKPEKSSDTKSKLTILHFLQSTKQTTESSS